MRVPRVDVRVCSMASPSDMSELEALLDSGAVTAESVVALIAKTEGTGLHDDSGRELADLRFREVLAARLGTRREDVPDRVSMIISGGCFGVISPHVTVVSQTWEEVDAAEVPTVPALVIGKAFSEEILPEDIGRVAQMQKVAAAVRTAVSSAGVENPRDVHCVMVKAPSLSRAGILEAEARGQSVVTRDLSVGVDSAMSYANDGSALGVALALGEVQESALRDEIVRRDWTLYSEVATTSAGGEKHRAEVVVLGNAAPSLSRLRVGHGVIRDPIDADGVKDALRSAGLHFDCCPGREDQARIVQVFAKMIVPGADPVRGRRITMFDDPELYRTAKVVGGTLVASVVGDLRISVSGGEKNSHQGPPGGSPCAAIVRTE